MKFSRKKNIFPFKTKPAKPRITCLSLLENTVSGGNCNRTISKEAGDYFLVQCKASAIPPAKYKWEKKYNDTHWVPIRDHIVKVSFYNLFLSLIQFNRALDNFDSCTDSFGPFWNNTFTRFVIKFTLFFKDIFDCCYIFRRPCLIYFFLLKEYFPERFHSIPSSWRIGLGNISLSRWKQAWFWWRNVSTLRQRSAHNLTMYKGCTETTK